MSVISEISRGGFPHLSSENTISPLAHKQGRPNDHIPSMSQAQHLNGQFVIDSPGMSSINEEDSVGSLASILPQSSFIAAATSNNTNGSGNGGNSNNNSNNNNNNPNNDSTSSSTNNQPGAIRLADQLRSFDALRGNLNDRLRHRLENMRCSREESYKAKFNAFQIQGYGADFNGNRWRRDAEDSKRGARERILESHPWFGKLCATAGYEKGKIGPEMQVVNSVRMVIEKTGEFQQHDFRVLVESLPPESIARTGVQKIVSFIRDGLRIGFKDISRSNVLPSLKKQSIAVQQSQGAQEKLAKLSPRLPLL